MPYLKVSLVFFIFQTGIFHNKLIQNPVGAIFKKKKKSYQSKENESDAM